MKSASETREPTFAEEPESPAVGEGTSGGSGEEELRQLRADLLKFQDLALRSQADLDNFRKRMVREKEESIRYANASLLEKLLPVLDSFELGLQASANSGSAADLHHGFSLVQKQLLDFLRDHGVEEISAVGHPFDPNFHEAVGQIPSAEPEGTVCQQLRKGYRLKDRLLRPATVMVSKGAGPEA